MRMILAASVLLIATSAMTPASAVDYPWCANYGDSNGGINCGFVSLEQCRAAISGNGGSCMENGFATAVQAPVRTKKPKRVER